MTLADAADGRVAAHLAQGFDIVGEQQGLDPHACCSQCRFGTGMAAADHDHIETGWEIHVHLVPCGLVWKNGQV